MVTNGVQRVKKDFRDYDFLKSKTLAGVTFNVKTLPDEFTVDQNLWQPNQNAMGLPYGCTGMTQADLCSNEDQVLYDPYWIYDNTPPGGRDQGRNIRESLSKVCDDSFTLKRYLAEGEGKPRKAYFRVRKAGKIDYFDAIRIAIWINQGERRAVSCATPWFPEWEGVGKDGILPEPKKYVWGEIGHNWAIPGWKTINGEPYLIVKSWQGEEYGDKGYAYMSRTIANKLFNMWDTGAFTLADDDAVATVDRTVIEVLVNFIRNLFNV